MELLLGNEFVCRDGRKITCEEVKKAKIVLVYFSGIWCPPCNNQFFVIFGIGKGFLPAIKSFYKEANAGCDETNKNVEIIFASCDNNKEEYDEHFAELPFPGLPYGDPTIEKLEEVFDVENIPVVPLIRKNGTIGNDNVRRLINDSGAKCFQDLLKCDPSP